MKQLVAVLVMIVSLFALETVAYSQLAFPCLCYEPTTEPWVEDDYSSCGLACFSYVYNPDDPPEHYCRYRSTYYRETFEQHFPFDPEYSSPMFKQMLMEHCVLLQDECYGLCIPVNVVFAERFYYPCTIPCI